MRGKRSGGLNKKEVDLTMKMVYRLRLRSPYGLMSKGEGKDFRAIDLTH
jgi:hypothetical protein